MSTTTGLGVRWKISAMGEYTAHSALSCSCFLPNKVIAKSSL